MLIIGISGGTGCGKTTVVSKLLREFPNDMVSVISQDSYYKKTSHLPVNKRVNLNYDSPDAIDFELLINHLIQLKSNLSIQQPVYDFVNHNRTDATASTHPKNIILVEGILIFNNLELRNLFDVKIFIHADDDERLIRRIKRDTSERGRDLDEVLLRYQNTLKPMHEAHIEPMKAYADMIIPNHDHSDLAIKMLKTVITKKCNL